MAEGVANIERSWQRRRGIVEDETIGEETISNSMDYDLEQTPNLPKASVSMEQ